MHVNYIELPRPAESVLDRCHAVYINDPAFRMWRMKEFCRENSLSLIWSELVDTTDVSAYFDEAAAFYFIDPADATFFTLKFKR
jgi:hypothetical protein